MSEQSLFSVANGGNWLSSLGNDGDAWGKTLLGAHGGSGAGGGGLGGAQYFERAAVSGIGMLTTAMQAGYLESAYRQQAEMAANAAKFQGQLSAEDYARQGDAAARNIGIVQQGALDQSTLRYNALRSEIAGQRVAAAGSGIDISSRTVGKAEESSRKAAAWDVSRISLNAKIAADNYNAQAEAAYRNSAYAQIGADYQAKMAKIQGDMNAELAGISGKFGLVRGGLNVGMNLGKGVADIFSGGWVSNADAARSVVGA